MIDIIFTYRRLPVLLLIALLSSCASIPGNDNEPGNISSSIVIRADERNLQSLLLQADNLPSPDSERVYLQAAELLKTLNRETEASDILGSLDTATLDLQLAADIWKLSAELLILSRQFEAALELLNSPRLAGLPQLNVALQIDIRLLRASAYLNSNQYLASAIERIYINKLLPTQEISQNHEQIWSALTTLPADRLQSLAENSLSFEFQGWYELGVIGKAYQYNLDRQLVELERWQESWTRHPASSELPQALQLVRTMAEERPDKIALLLPLKTAVGKVVRDGFMSAYFNFQEIGGKVPFIQFYDTTDVDNILELHQQARLEGAQMIIGPLQKQHVAALQQVASLAIPTLALNNIENVTPISEQLYQFALSPEDEARQIAMRAWQDGHRYVAILSPQELSGDDSYSRKRQSFTAEWKRLGGRIVAQEVFRDNYTDIIEALLDLSDSEYRKDRLSDLIDESLEFTQRRRQDIDFIFLIAQPSPARQINPSLAYLYAGDIPVYATQDVYSGIPRPLEDSDLNGVLFSDSPWLLSNQDELKTDVQFLFPQNTGLYLRLQAFGIDAFRLYPRLKQLESVPDSHIYGATGLLKMEANRNIVRQLSWARIEAGLARLIDQSD